MKKNSFLVLTLGKFLEALGSGIGTVSIFCLSFSLSNRVLNSEGLAKAQVLRSSQRRGFSFCNTPILGFFLKQTCNVKWDWYHLQSVTIVFSNFAGVHCIFISVIIKVRLNQFLLFLKTILA